ncbi:MAG: hypothetical protein ACXABY_32740, partial [Candidatus Thorarchaeota archaeon]
MAFQLKVRKRASALADYYSRLLMWMIVVSGVLVMVTAIYTTIDVGGRYLANNPLPATFEITVTLMVFIV